MDGADPEGRLMAIGDTLYGMTNNGGTANLGTIFSFTADDNNAVSEPPSLAILLMGLVAAGFVRLDRAGKA